MVVLLFIYSDTISPAGMKHGVTEVDFQVQCSYSKVQTHYAAFSRVCSSTLWHVNEITLAHLANMQSMGTPGNFTAALHETCFYHSVAPQVLQERNLLRSIMATCCRYAIIRTELSQNDSLLQRSSYVGMSEISLVISAAMHCVNSQSFSHSSSRNC